MSTQAPTTRAVKYTFDTVFGEPPAAPQAAPRPRSSYSADEVERIKNDTFEAGKADAEARAATLKADAVGNVSAGLAQLLRSVGEMEAALRAESVELALIVGRKLAEASLGAFPLREVEQVVTDCLHKLHREARLVVRVPVQLTEALQAEVQGLADRHGFAGRIVVLPDNALAGADCRVEWAGGGLERDLNTNLAAIDEAVGRWRALIAAEGKS